MQGTTGAGKHCWRGQGMLMTVASAEALSRKTTPKSQRGISKLLKRERKVLKRKENIQLKVFIVRLSKGMYISLNFSRRIMAFVL